MTSESRLTQSFLGLSDDAFREVPVLEKKLANIINSHLDEYRSSTGTVMTALACVVGEFTISRGPDAPGIKAKFLEVLDAYISAGSEGARTGPDSGPSLVRKFIPWRG